MGSAGTFSHDLGTCKTCRTRDLVRGFGREGARPRVESPHPLHRHAVSVACGTWRLAPVCACAPARGARPPHTADGGGGGSGLSASRHLNMGVS
eukprot:scaffold16496_cov120-Isochrysis_galbana.AAC.8